VAADALDAVPDTRAALRVSGNRKERMNNIELTALPCPFCGGKDVSFDCNAYDTWWIMCECGVEINDCSSPQHAFERWNTRVSISSGIRK
jgi:hypothetical protein